MSLNNYLLEIELHDIIHSLNLTNHVFRRKQTWFASHGKHFLMQKVPEEESGRICTKMGYFHQVQVLSSNVFFPLSAISFFCQVSFRLLIIKNFFFSIELVNITISYKICVCKNSLRNLRNDVIYRVKYFCNYIVIAFSLPWPDEFC